MTEYGDGRYVCHTCRGEFLVNPERLNLQEQPKAPPAPTHISQPWPELAAGVPEHLRQGMVDVATIPLGVYSPGECQGHGGKGGGRRGGRGKSPARQKMDAWQRKTSPGSLIRSFRPK